MAKVKQLKKIEVLTLPNGYSLTFEGMKQPHGYMYFTPEKLLEGFMAHIGLGMTDQLNMENIQDFLVAVMNWNEEKKNVKEIERLNTQLRMSDNSRVAIAKRLITERNRFLAMVDGIGKMANEFKANKEVKDRLYALIKNFSKIRPYTMKDFSVNAEMINNFEQDQQQQDEETDDE